MGVVPATNPLGPSQAGWLRDGWTPTLRRLSRGHEGGIVLRSRFCAPSIRSRHCSRAPESSGKPPWQYAWPGPVYDPGDDVPHVVLPRRRVREDAVDFAAVECGRRGWLPIEHPTGTIAYRAGQRADAMQARRVVRLAEVDRAADGGVHLCAAELLVVTSWPIAAFTSAGPAR